jgi:hypothetical protein
MQTPAAADPRLAVPEGTALDFEIAWRDGALRHRLRESGAIGWQALEVPALWVNRRRAVVADRVQRLSLRLRSRGWFTHNPSGHAALALRAAVVLPPDRPPPGSLEGLGLAIGDVSEAPHGCPHPPAAQVESFWFPDNRLVPGAWSEPLQEDRWYAIDLAVDAGARLHGEVRDAADGRALARLAYVDPDAARRPANLAGWFLAVAFTEQSRGDWTLDVAGFRETWERAASG